MRNALFLSVSAAVVFTPLRGDGDGDSARPAQADSRKFEITYTARVADVPEDAGRLDVWIPLPSDNTYQEVRLLEVESPVEYRITREGKYGNRMIHASIDDPPRDVTIEYHLRALRRENSPEGTRSTDTGVLDWALEEETLIPITDSARQMALEAVGGSAGSDERARKLYENALEQLDYDRSGTGWGRGDFQYACDVGKGNCTDFHSYFIGLCRNLGIPAYFEMGISVPRDPDGGETGTYHCWAYYWNGSAWIPVDISEADKHPERADYFFGNHDADRLAFSVGRDIVLNPPQKGQPLNYFVLPYAEVDGQVHNDVTKTTTYRPLAGSS